MELATAIALTLGVGWASGINLYAALLTLGIAGLTGTVDLPESLAVAEHPLVLAAAGLMYAINFFTDKVPGLDSLADIVHTFVRVPAGILLAFAAAQGIPLDPALQLALGLVGGTLAAGSHVTKAGSRALINASPEPFSNWAASLGEDVAVIGGLLLAAKYPWLFLGALAALAALTIWLLPKLVRVALRAFRRVAGRRAPLPQPAVPPVVQAARRT